MKRFSFKTASGLAMLLVLSAIAPATAAVESQTAQPETVQLAQSYVDNFLQEGDQGVAVVALQRALGRNGLYEISDIDGLYGPLTVNAVKKYQANRGLAVTGVADFETLNALGISDVVLNQARLVYPGYGELSTDALFPNDQGFDVRVLQLVLRNELRHDDTVTLNSFYDDATRQAVRVFQRARGIQVTGVADRGTLLEMGFQDVRNVGRDPINNVGGVESPVPYYAIVVAGRNQLDAVQQVYGDAFVISTLRGEVISIGAFSTFSAAQDQAAQAQGRGFTAQVIDGAERY